VTRGSPQGTKKRRRSLQAANIRNGPQLFAQVPYPESHGRLFLLKWSERKKKDLACRHPFEERDRVWGKRGFVISGGQSD